MPIRLVRIKKPESYIKYLTELKHTIENATRLCHIFQNKLFSEKNKKKVLIEQKEQRSRLLRSISNDATNIYEFLLDFSLSPDEEESKEDRKSENEPSKSSRKEVKRRHSARLKNLKDQKAEKRKLSPEQHKKTLRK